MADQEEIAMSGGEQLLIITSQQIRDRIAVIEKVLESWRGIPEYANTISMEIWSLKLAADLLEAAEKIVAGSPDASRSAMSICETFATEVAKDG